MSGKMGKSIKLDGWIVSVFSSYEDIKTIKVKGVK